EFKAERLFYEELEPEEFSSPLKLADIPRLEKNWFDCIRNGGTPLASIDLAIRAHVVLALAEMAERLSLTLLFDEKSRAVKTGDGRVVKPLSYDKVLPASPVLARTAGLTTRSTSAARRLVSEDVP